MSKRLERLRWCIVGPGTIASVFAQAIRGSGAGELVHVYGRSPARGMAFCQRFGGEFAADLSTALKQVDALYVATPHTSHAAYAEAGLRAGLAVLCEKPMTVSPPRTRQLYALAAAQKLPLLEAWMYRCHPQIARAKALLANGVIGTPKKFRSWFGFEAPFDAASRLYASAAGGGGIFDVGGYPLSAALTFLEQLDPQVVEVSGTLAETGVDQCASMTMQFAQDVVAELSVAINEATGTGLQIEGTEGTLSIPQPFLLEGHNFGRRGGIRITDNDGKAREETVESEFDCYALEAMALTQMLRLQRTTPPLGMVDQAESVAIATFSEVWRERLGVAAAHDDP